MKPYTDVWISRFVSINTLLVNIWIQNIYFASFDDNTYGKEPKATDRGVLKAINTKKNQNALTHCSRDQFVFMNSKQ